MISNNSINRALKFYRRKFFSDTNGSYVDRPQLDKHTGHVVSPIFRKLASLLKTI